MEFHLAFNPKPFQKKINHQDKLFLIGSCFTENIGAKLKQLKFSVIENPNGILFNPISISDAINGYLQQKIYSSNDLFFQNECWNSWQHHSRFSHPNQEQCLQLINASQITAHQYLQNADWMLITLGSAFVYELEDKSVAANCHKVPTDKFNKKLLTAGEVETTLQQMCANLKAFNAKLNIVFTISPVRHLRDGFIENNRSKANLIQAVHSVVEKNENNFYFPAYELVIDDLRDYRFFAEDMVHPNYAATNYVWEKFIQTVIDEPTQLLMKEINVINAAKNHRAFNPSSEQHKLFLLQHLEKVTLLTQRFPYINFKSEVDYFAESLDKV
jgi:hypothetical protein